ncbi:MAG: hypothetical protein RL684_2401 [Pseudomonadota bacterium]|jgi:hypothetical protein
MRIGHQSLVGLALASLVLLGCAGAANAGTIVLGSPAIIANAPSYEFLNPTGAANVLTNNVVDYALQVPGQYQINRQFSAPQPNALLATSGAGSYSFQDTYVFTVPVATAGDVLTATLNLGNIFNISNLQVRMYGFAQGSALPGPTVGSIPGGALTPIPWTGFATGQNSLTLNFTAIPAGTYYIDIRGSVTGSAGGSYLAALNVAPVPLPAALPMLLSGLGLLGLRRRRTMH